MPDILTSSLRASAIGVEALSRTWVIPALPARDWIEAVAAVRCPWSIFPGLLTSADMDQALDPILDGSADDFEMRVAGFEAIHLASGRPWWEAMRLVRMADDDLGDMVGRLAVAGIDPGTVPFALWCAAVYHLATKGADQKELLKFNNRLQAPPSMPEAFEASDQDDFAAMVEMARSLPGMSG